MAPNAFVATEAAVGALVRGRLTLGLGEPFTKWTGIDVEAMSFAQFARGSLMWHGQQPGLDASVGGAWTRSYVRSFLTPQDSFDSLAASGPRASYLSLEANLTAYAPLPLGLAMLWLEGHIPQGLSRDRWLYDETLRAVVGPHASIASRLAWLNTTQSKKLYWGPMAEHVWLGGRSRHLLRVGGALTYAFSQRWVFNVALTTPVAGPDELDLWPGMWGTASFRYRWATGQQTR